MKKLSHKISPHPIVAHPSMSYNIGIYSNPVSVELERYVRRNLTNQVEQKIQRRGSIYSAVIDVIISAEKKS